MGAGRLQIVLYTNNGSHIEHSASMIGVGRKACQARLAAVREIPEAKWQLGAKSVRVVAAPVWPNPTLNGMGLGKLR
jgi:hypothetical protein